MLKFSMAEAAYDRRISNELALMGMCSCVHLGRQSYTCFEGVICAAIVL